MRTAQQIVEEAEAANKARVMVLKSRLEYEKQVKTGCYLCDRPLTLDEAMQELKEEQEQRS